MFLTSEVPLQAHWVGLAECYHPESGPIVNFRQIYRESVPFLRQKLSNCYKKKRPGALGRARGVLPHGM